MVPTSLEFVLHVHRAGTVKLQGIVSGCLRAFSSKSIPSANAIIFISYTVCGLVFFERTSTNAQLCKAAFTI